MARILVIDDENNIRMMLRLALTHVGHEVETAADGYEGLEKFGDGSGWNLIVLDQRMPGIEGLEVLREMRQRAPDSRVLMITAFGTIDLAAEAIATGATDFLRKPFTVETLRGAVGATLAGGPDSRATLVRPIPYSFEMANINGFRLTLTAALERASNGEQNAKFAVTSASGEKHLCRVSLPPYLVELVKAHTDREELPGGDNFWQALCGEALANYLWQNARVPDGDKLTVEELTSGLRHWVDAMLSTEGK